MPSDAFKSSFLNLFQPNILPMTSNFKLTFQESSEALPPAAPYMRVLATLNVWSPGSYCGINGGSLSSLTFK